MPAPSRVDHPSKLTDEALYCHCFGHSWWVSEVKRTAINIGKSPQDRQFYACANGCGCRKRCLIDTENGDRWGWSTVQGENYGTIGGWVKTDFILEWIKRQVLGAPKRVDFTFNEETFSLERKGKRKAKAS